jgi:hypothetical protein
MRRSRVGSRRNRLPDTNGVRNEVIRQKAHRSCYDNQLTGDPGEAGRCGHRGRRQAGGGRTALMFFLNVAEPDGKRGRREWVALARRHLLDVPPVGRLREYTRVGFDPVALSEAQALRGPNDTGLLLGRKGLVEAARRNNNPPAGELEEALDGGHQRHHVLLADLYHPGDGSCGWRLHVASVTKMTAMGFLGNPFSPGTERLNKFRSSPESPRANAGIIIHNPTRPP